MQTCILQDYDPERQKEVAWQAFLTNESGNKTTIRIRLLFYRQYGYFPQAVFRTTKTLWQAGPIIEERETNEQSKFAN